MIVQLVVLAGAITWVLVIRKVDQKRSQEMNKLTARWDAALVDEILTLKKLNITVGNINQTLRRGIQVLENRPT